MLETQSEIMPPFFLFPFLHVWITLNPPVVLESRKEGRKEAKEEGKEGGRRKERREEEGRKDGRKGGRSLFTLPHLVSCKNADDDLCQLPLAIIFH